MAVEDLEDFTRAFLLKAHDPENEIITVKADDKGNLVIVAKGAFAGLLKTLATDEDGRILMIPYDPENIWGESVGVGNAELASRLQSARGYYRRGETFLLEDFRRGMGMWTGDSYLGTGTQSLSTEYSEFGGFAVKLYTGINVSDYCSIAGYIPAPLNTKVGLQANVFSDESVSELHLLGGRYYQDTFQGFGLRLDPVDDKIYYFNSAGGWTDTGETYSYGHYWPNFMPHKVIVDLEINEYLRARIGHKTIDLTGIALRNVEIEATEGFTSEVLIYPVDTENATAYVDAIIVTQNEPATA
ncbi:MAG: hypothetical protein HWN68_11820 [Desulfobacterales bacterium]|nr:hypothetical protein [Desulfobacterales bacterium]